jgi:hypothetical protein
MIGARSHSPNCLRAELQKSLKIKKLFGAVRKRTSSRPLSGRRGGTARFVQNRTLSGSSLERITNFAERPECFGRARVRPGVGARTIEQTRGSPRL